MSATITVTDFIGALPPSPDTTRRWTIRGAHPFFEKDVQREAIRPGLIRSSDIGAIPGLMITEELLHASRQRGGILNLIGNFASRGFSLTGEAWVKISPETERAAKALIRLLPSSSALPKISPEADGALAMVWPQGGTHLLVLVEDWRIHVAVHAGTPEVAYYPDIAFDGLDIPEPIAVNLRRA